MMMVLSSSDFLIIENAPKLLVLLLLALCSVLFLVNLKEWLELEKFNREKEK